MLMFVLSGLLTPVTLARDLPHLGERPRTTTYRRISDLGGPIRGRYARRNGAWKLWRLRNGTVVRAQRSSRGRVVEERRFDASGWPISTFRDGGPVPRVQVHTAPPRELVLSGWSRRDVAGGEVRAPLAPLTTADGRSEFPVLGGTFAVWHEPTFTDPFDEGFTASLEVGCGCHAIDEAATWVDGRAARRVRLESLTQSDRAVTDLWLVPLGEANEAGQPQGLWIASYRVESPAEDVRALAPGRALIGLVRLDDLRSLVAPRPEEGPSGLTAPPVEEPS